MEPTSIPARPESILIVDDRAANLRVLSEILKPKGYKIRPVPSGKLALDAAERDPPDLILLDIVMPEMDGYEVCRRFKGHAALQHVPVIFISVLDETADKVKGFHAGGVDYIPSPFQAEEVLARVEAHLTLHRYRKALAEKTRQLETSYCRLQEVENLRDQLTHMIVHDMRNLLTGIMCSLQMLVATHGSTNEKSARYLRSALKSADDLTLMINNLLDVSKLEANEMTLRLAPCDPISLVGEAMEKLEATRQARDIRLQDPRQEITVVADRDILLRVVINLLDNAIKFTAVDGTIVLGVEPVGDKVRFSIRDNGVGIPVADQEKIFAKFGQVAIRQSGNKCSTGLGLTFCKLAVEAHRGKIWVESEAGGGSTFFFELPGKIDPEPCATGPKRL